MARGVQRWKQAWWPVAVALAAAALALLALASSAGAPPAHAAARPVKVLIAKYGDDASYPYTPAQLEAAVFNGQPNNVNGFFQAVLGDTLTNLGIQSVDVPMTRAEVTSCDNIAFGWPNLLDEAIDAAGGPFPGAAHVIVAAPKHSACSRSGGGDIGGFGGGRVILNGNILWRLIAHEMFHNLGARHAGACNPAFPAKPCGGNDYGDVFDIMGASTGALAGFPSSWIQVRTGILPPAAEKMAEQDGTYSLTASNNTAAGGTKLLMIPRGSGAGDGYGYYALETRMRRTYDDFLPASARLYNGVTVRLASRATGPPGVPENTQLVPAHHDANPRNWPLAACETFTDPAAGVSLRVLEAGGRQGAGTGRARGQDSARRAGLQQGPFRPAPQSHHQQASHPRRLHRQAQAGQHHPRHAQATPVASPHSLTGRLTRWREMEWRGSRLEDGARSDLSTS